MAKIITTIASRRYIFLLSATGLLKLLYFAINLRKIGHFQNGKCKAPRPVPKTAHQYKTAKKIKRTYKNTPDQTVL
jgi:hypothetical protein